VRRTLLLATLAAACQAREPTPASLAQAIAAARVPVLLPRDLPLERARLTTADTFTALHLPLDGGVTVSLHSARLAHHHPGVRAAGAPRAMRGGTGQVTVNEGVRTATWIEDGVAHALDVECGRPDDARCADDRFLLSLVDGLGAP
jgi:hypothetical protein